MKVGGGGGGSKEESSQDFVPITSKNSASVSPCWRCEIKVKVRRQAKSEKRIWRGKEIERLILYESEGDRGKREEARRYSY